jgi:hypothetical protein
MPSGRADSAQIRIGFEQWHGFQSGDPVKVAERLVNRGLSEGELMLPQSEDFCDAGSGIIERQQRGVIALPDPRLRIWSGENPASDSYGSTTANKRTLTVHLSSV